MRFFYFLLSLGLLALGEPGNSPAEESTPSSRRYIIEVAQDSDLDAIEASLLSHPGTRIFKRFNHEVFTGFSLESTSDTLASLSSLKGVSKAWTSNKIGLNVRDGGGTVPLSDDNIEDDGKLSAHSAYNLHDFTGVAKAHKSGIRGKGVKVAVVDTGVLYTHPVLGGGYGPEYKVVGGYDLVGSLYPSGPRQPDDDPIPESTEPQLSQSDHGTHISGIIVGSSERFTGVAPEASVLAYKVFGHNNQGDEEVFIEAFLRAYDDGADIINASVGGHGGFSESAWTAIASRLVDKGVVVVVPAGNSGANGPFLPDSGGCAKNVLAVGGIDPQHKPATTHITVGFQGGKEMVVPMMTMAMPGENFKPVTLPVWYPTKGFNACEPLPKDLDLSGHVVLASQEGCGFWPKVGNITSRNAKHMVFYNDGQVLSTAFDMYPEVPPFFAGTIEEHSARPILAALAKSEAINITLSPPHPDRPLALFDPQGERPLDFTSWGGLYDLSLKPDVSAYASHIHSTSFTLGKSKEFIPGWRMYSGTSLSAPYVAGVAALWIGEYGGRDKHGPGFAKELHQRIISSGETVRWGVPLDNQAPTKNLPPDDALAPASQVGSGSIDAWKVLTYNTSLDYETFALNDTANFIPTHTLKITNNADEEVTYSFDHEPLSGYEARAAKGPFIGAYKSIKVTDIAADIDLPKDITVQAGESAEVEFTFEPPVCADESRLPCYSGRILVSSSMEEELAVPYFGAAFDLKEQFCHMFAPDSQKYLESHNATCNYTFEWFNQTFTTPSIPVELVYGTRELRADIYESGWKEKSWSYPPIPGKDGHVGSVVDVLSMLMRVPPLVPKPFPLPNQPRSISRETEMFRMGGMAWQGQLADGSWIKPGKYVFRLAALRPFGDPGTSGDWDVWEAPEITVNDAKQEKGE